MQWILEGLPGVECQMDDIIVYDTNQAEHDERLETVLIRLQEANATVNGEKCEFSKTTFQISGPTGGQRGNPR